MKTSKPSQATDYVQTESTLMSSREAFLARTCPQAEAGLALLESVAGFGMNSLGEILPRFVIVENSPELLDGWLGDVLGPLATFGYDAEWHCIPLANTGAPHGRDRAWVIAYPAGFRQQGQGQLVKSVPATPEAYRQADQLKRAFRQGDLPYVCGGHDGLSSFVDREAVGALGNAVGPSIPELIGHAILASIHAPVGNNGGMA